MDGARHPFKERAVAQCQGITRKGDQCKRDAKPKSSYCAIHQDQEVRPPDPPRGDMEWDSDAIMKAALGFALVGVILLLRFRR